MGVFDENGTTRFGVHTMIPKDKHKSKQKKSKRYQRGEEFASYLGTRDVGLARAGMDKSGTRTGGFLDGVVHNA